MKKIFLIFMMLVLFLGACGSKKEGYISKQETSTLEYNSDDETNSEGNSSDEINKSSDEGLKSLVVYFSWSGNTENVAKSIQKETNSDIFEIIPSTPYSDDYESVVNVAKEEQKNNVRPQIADTIENIEQYDIIYVGFPNWWGDMPMILYTFFDSYNLSDKTIAPFCTSGGSGLSNTINEIEKLEPDSIVTKGLHIDSESSSNPDEEVIEWLNDIER